MIIDLEITNNVQYCIYCLYISGIYMWKINIYFILVHMHIYSWNNYNGKIYKRCTFFHNIIIIVYTVSHMYVYSSQGKIEFPMGFFCKRDTYC